jgi:hypothetical protein
MWDNILTHIGVHHTILRTLPEYLEVLTSNRPQSNKA